jgi:subtilase family serine protease
MRSNTCAFALLLFIAVTGLAFAPGLAFAEDLPPAASRILKPIDEANLVPLEGNTHPLALPEYDQGPLADGFPMEHMLLLLKRSSQQELELQKLIAELYNPGSPHYHKWLTSQKFGQLFGPSQQDITTITKWLRSRGFQVNLVYTSGMLIDISGTAGLVRDAFHTEMHKYNVEGVKHIANASDPRIAAGLAPVVEGFASLNDFMPRPAMEKRGRPEPQFVSFVLDVGPQDFATIYNLTPLWNAGITGEEQTIAVLEDTDINPADWDTFRSAFGLSSFSGSFAQIHPAPPKGKDNCKDPLANPDESEAALDAEWSGAVAPDAAIELTSCADTATTFGVLIAAHNLLNSKSPPPIISVSYQESEADLGSSGNAVINRAMQQAAAEGISVFVASGDAGAADRDANELDATRGITVNGLASTQYDVAVGGTDFQDVVDGTASSYWATSDGAGGKSALSYIPEMTWNDTCASSVLFNYEGSSSGPAFCSSPLGEAFFGVVAGGGGPSSRYAKPSWQAGVVGIENDRKRDLPDASLFSANGLYTHALLYCMSDAVEGGFPCIYTNPIDVFSSSAGGTSFAAPSFAGIQALVNQKTNATWGNPDSVLYTLAATEYGSSTNPNQGNLESCNSTNGNAVGSACVFYDVTTGDNDVVCSGKKNCYRLPHAAFGVLSVSPKTLSAAYPTTTGWDFATGLGTVNISNLVNSWP